MRLRKQDSGFGCPVVVFAGREDSIGPAVRSLADVIHLTNIAERPALEHAVRAVAAGRGAPSAAVSFTELAQVPTAHVAEAIGLPTVGVDVARRVRDKAATRRHLQGSTWDWTHISGTADHIVRSLAHEPLNQGWIIKPVDGQGSEAISLVRSRAQLDEWHRRLGAPQRRWIAERAAVGREFSVEAVSHDGCARVITITEKLTSGAPHFVEIGHLSPADLPGATRAHIERWVVGLLHELGVNCGATHTELILDQAGLVLVETHTRPGGDCIPELARLTTGVDQYELALASLSASQPSRVDACSSAGSFRTAGIAFVSSYRSGSFGGLKLPELPPGVELVRGEIDESLGAAVTPASSSFDRLGYAILAGANRESVSSAVRLVATATDVVRTFA